MKQGRTLTELAQELDRQANAKRDFVADSRLLYMDPVSNDMEIQMQETESFPMTRHASRQVADWAKIPAAYYDRMPNDLRAVNVNHWLKNEPAKRMVRTLDGEARAFMSDRYRVLDNYDLAQAVLPILMDVPDMQIASTQLTDNRMYIKALFPRIEGEVGLNDPVQSGVVISNSEIGQGALKVEPMVYRLVCLNGMISGYSQKKYHLGRSNGAEFEASEIFSDRTLEQDDKALWMKLQDTVRASVDQAGFDKIVEEMRRTKEMLITGDPVAAVEMTQKKFQLNDTERGGVLSHLIQGGDLSAYGLLNAITRTSQDVEDYDRATELERMGGQVIELNRSQWKEIAEAA